MSGFIDIGQQKAGQKTETREKLVFGPDIHVTCKYPTLVSVYTIMQITGLIKCQL